MRTRVLIAREPASAITRYAREQSIELIAMASYGHSGLTRRIGGVTSRVLRDGMLPVPLYWLQERYSSTDDDMPSLLFSERERNTVRSIALPSDLPNEHLSSER
jgi:hypothetical protein